MSRVVAVVCATAGVMWLGPLALPAAPAHAVPDCRDIVIGVGGNRQRFAETYGLPNMIGQHLDQAAADGFRVESVDYPSSVWPVGPYTKDHSVTEGKAALRAAVDGYRAECPGGRVTVIGHSLGAEIAGDEADIADDVVLYGDPRTPGGIYDALPGFVPGVSSPGRRENLPHVTSVCHEWDVVCDAPSPLADPARFVQGVQGALTGWHYYPPGEADQYAPGSETVVDLPAPNPLLPESTPTGLPTVHPAAPIPTWEPGPLPSLQPVLPTLPEYVPTPVREFIPDEVEHVLPPEVLDFAPPPLPDLGVRFP